MITLCRQQSLLAETPGCFGNKTPRYYASNFNIVSIVSELMLTHNADTALVDCENCLPLLRILQCPCVNSTDGSASVLLSQSHTHNRQCDSTLAAIDSIHHSVQNNAGALTTAPVNESRDDTATCRSSRLYQLLELFCLKTPQCVQSVLNKGNETALFYLLRKCSDYGKSVDDIIII